MSTSGPSKEELSDYWSNNRQYFDELSKYYLESDREYYNKYIAPFYNNPFHSASSSKGNNSGRLIVLMIAIIGVIGAGAAAFFVMMQSSPVKVDNKKIISPQVILDTVKRPETHIKNNADTTAKIIQTNSPYYEKAMKYYHNKDYDAAEQYFMLIEKNDKNYNNAQKRLLEIKFLRKDKDTQEDPPVEPKNNSRKKPIERIR